MNRHVKATNRYEKVINRLGGQSEFHRLTGIPKSTISDLYTGKREGTKSTKLLFSLLELPPIRVIRAAAKRAAERN